MTASNLHGVAFGAFALLRAVCKLSAVGIWFVTHSTGLERNLFFEVPAQVTGDATDRGMFSKKREFCFRVIEFEIGCNFLPTRGGVAMFAGFFELTAMRIEMTRIARRKFHVFETRRAAGGLGLVTFFAGNSLVQTGQRVARLGVIELLCGLPIRSVMAARAILAQLSFVIVHVAGHTFLRHTEIGLAEIFILNQRTFRGPNVGRSVALLAFHLGMLAI